MEGCHQYEIKINSNQVCSIHTGQSDPRVGGIIRLDNFNVQSPFLSVLNFNQNDVQDVCGLSANSSLQIIAGNHNKLTELPDIKNKPLIRNVQMGFNTLTGHLYSTIPPNMSHLNVGFHNNYVFRFSDNFTQPYRTDGLKPTGNGRGPYDNGASLTLPAFSGNTHPNFKHLNLARQDMLSGMLSPVTSSMETYIIGPHIGSKVPQGGININSTQSFVPNLSVAALPYNLYGNCHIKCYNTFGADLTGYFNSKISCGTEQTHDYQIGLIDMDALTALEVFCVGGYPGTGFNNKATDGVPHVPWMHVPGAVNVNSGNTNNMMSFNAHSGPKKLHTVVIKGFGANRRGSGSANRGHSKFGINNPSGGRGHDIGFIGQSVSAHKWTISQSMTNIDFSYNLFTSPQTLNVLSGVYYTAKHYNLTGGILDMRNNFAPRCFDSRGESCGKNNCVYFGKTSNLGVTRAGGTYCANTGTNNTCIDRSVSAAYFGLTRPVSAGGLAWCVKHTPGNYFGWESSSKPTDNMSVSNQGYSIAINNWGSP